MTYILETTRAQISRKSIVFACKLETSSYPVAISQLDFHVGVY